MRFFNVKRYIFLLAFILVVCAVFISRLVDWQIFNYEYYKTRANSSNIYFLKTDPVRGEILDCYGEGLAVNDTGYKVILNRLAVEKSRENEVVLEVIDLLESLGSEWIDILPIGVNSDGFYFEENQESQIKSLKTFLGLSEGSSAENCINKLCVKYDISNINHTDAERRILCSIKYNIDKNGGGYYSKSVPYVLSEKVSKEAVIVIAEKSDELPGVIIQTSLVRKYVNGTVAPHIVGYTGFMSSEEYEQRKDTYSMDELIGKSGVERFLEDDLRGIGGTRMVQMSNVGGEIINVSEKKPAKAGNTVFLTLSSKLQEVANKSLKENVEKAHQIASDATSGAAVVLNVKDFSVLAAATYPSYDLTRFMEDRSYYTELAGDKAVPLLNRAFSGAYAPGSIYKPLVACAALQSGKIKPSETVYCGGSFNYYRGYSLKCMGVHGASNLLKALSKSCNVYFAELGRRLGATLLAEYANKFGIGVKTGVEIGESKGVVAGPEHSTDVGSHWYESGSSQAAIGQSDNMITPVQLATYTATIANGGKRYKTHIVKKIMDYARSKIIKEDAPELMEDTGISEENLKAVKEGMREVALSGTARDFANYPIPIGAKTGTAQNSGSDHTTFICFAPYDDPQIAISVVIAHGKSGTLSKNVARDIMDAYFDLKK
ncbi:MAG: penicillin-binding protein [Clostridia bacterium]|nr:penicillin-binding protein [Clostridia bacterium]